MPPAIEPVDDIRFKSIPVYISKRISSTTVHIPIQLQTQCQFSANCWLILIQKCFLVRADTGTLRPLDLIQSVILTFRMQSLIAV